MGGSLNFPVTKWGKSDASFVMATQWTLWPASKLGTSVYLSLLSLCIWQIIRHHEIHWESFPWGTTQTLKSSF